MSLCGFGSKVKLSFPDELGSVPSSVFWRGSARIGMSSSLNVWRNSLAKPSDPGLFFVGRFLMTDSAFLLVTGPFSYSVSS